MNKIIEFINYGLKGKEIVDENIRFVSEIDSLKNEIVDLTEVIDEQNKLNSGLRKEIAELKNPEKRQPKESDYFEKISEKYRWQKNKYNNLRNSLNKFSQDQDSQDKYFAFLNTLGIPDSYKDSDILVWSIVNKIYNYLEDLPNDYTSDINAFGTKEHWLTPQEAFDYYVTSEKAGDCEDFSAFLYGALVTALKYYGFGDELWKLKRVDIKRPVGHAILGWLKGNQWKRIESTYYRNDMPSKWNDNSDIFKSVYTVVWHIFDENSEYKLK
jgi:hypothetical protein